MGGWIEALPIIPQPRGPDDPDGPNIEWFRLGVVDPRKFDPYLFNPDHPANQSKAKGWSNTFGIGKGDGPLLELLIREQLDQADIMEGEASLHQEDPSMATRKWELEIPRFNVPNRRPAFVVTVWGLDPGNEYPHLITAIVRP